MTEGLTDEQIVQISKAVRAAEEMFGVERGRVRSSSRHRKVVLARRFACNACYARLQITGESVARAIAAQGNSAFFNSRKLFETQLEVDAELRRLWAEYNEKLDTLL